jgi:sugar phosphate isomerase/epimerase
MIIGNPMIFRHYPLDRAIRTMVDFGYQGIELWAPQIAGCKTDALRKQLAQFISALGLTTTGVNAADAAYFAALSSPQDATSILAGLKRDIDIVHALGADYLLTWEGRRPPEATGSDVTGWVLDTTVEIFRQAIAYASDKGVRLFIEVHPYTLGIDLEFSCQLYDRVDSTGFGITYDCCHFGVGRPSDYIDAIYKLEHRIQHLHFSDSDMVSSELHFAPGAGCLDLAGIVTALKEIHFQGPVMLDLWLYPFPEEGSRQGVAYLHDVLATLGLP